MSRNTLVRVKLWEMEQRERAIKFACSPRALGADTPVRVVWVPLALITHITRYRDAVCEWPECRVSMPVWKAEELQLDYE